VAFVQLDIANGEDAKDRLEQHWDNWITDDDWQYLVDCGFNTVRLPVGYHLSSQRVAPHTAEHHVIPDDRSATTTWRELSPISSKAQTSATTSTLFPAHGRESRKPSRKPAKWV
jgi:arylamine N-acetyltransferase